MSTAACALTLACTVCNARRRMLHSGFCRRLRHCDVLSQAPRRRAESLITDAPLEYAGTARFMATSRCGACLCHQPFSTERLLFFASAQVGRPKTDPTPCG